MFCIVNKKRLLFLFKWAVEKSNNNTNSLDKLNLGNLSSIIYYLSLYCNTP